MLLYVIRYHYLLSVEETENLASDVSCSGLIMGEDSDVGGQHQISELSDYRCALNLAGKTLLVHCSIPPKVTS